MQITYNKQADAMVVKFSSREIMGIRPVNDVMNVDLGTDGQIVGLELFRVSTYANKIDEIAAQYDIKRVLQNE